MDNDAIIIITNEKVLTISSRVIVMTTAILLFGTDWLYLIFLEILEAFIDELNSLRNSDAIYL